MNYYELVQWQKIDPSNGLVYPWFTHPFLAELERWDLRNCNVLEYGGGRSTAWWRKKAAFAVTIEANRDYAGWIENELIKQDLTNGQLILAESSEGDRTREEEYVAAWTQRGDFLTRSFDYDIVVVDGIFRYECMQEGIVLLRENPNGGKLIVDNWDQDGFLCPACVELMKPYEQEIFQQPDHTDHHGNQWKTAYFVIPAAV